MHILIVGNILKDVYLNLDSRTENFEADKHGTKWLDFSFDAKSHHFFSRHSGFGGATVTLEVLENLGLNARISTSDSSDDRPQATAYRYILTSEDNVSYLTPTTFPQTDFFASQNPVDYIFIDRSANLSKLSGDKILAFLDQNPTVKLVLYLKNYDNSIANTLASRADLVFSENNRGEAEFSQALPSNLPVLNYDSTVYLTEDALSFKNITEPVFIERIDKLTHLSAYSIAAATILGSFLLGKTIEDSLRLAALNVENSTLDSTLSLIELETLLSQPKQNLELVAATLMAPKKGILAADESGGSIQKKFTELGITDTFENRHNYRNLFFATPGIENYLSGVILFEETARDFTDTGESVPDFLVSHRIMPGIKVDQGLENFPNSTETYTKGLVWLPKRLREYHEMGLVFAKWRAAFNLTLDDNGEILTPTDRAINENCRILAEYAKDCQSAGIVPIVEPEVIYDGNYPIEKSAIVTGKILDQLILELQNFGVSLRACIIKCNMVLAGKQFKTPSTPEEVGRATAEVLKNHVSPEIAGIVFLSGGQTPEQATENLAAILKNGPFPWPITFSFARALQDPALLAWQGDNANTEKARQAFLDRLIANHEIL